MATESDIELNARAARYDAVAAIVAGFMDYNVKRGADGETIGRAEVVAMTTELYTKLKFLDDRPVAR